MTFLCVVGLIISCGMAMVSFFMWRFRTPDAKRRLYEAQVIVKNARYRQTYK